ncbi:MAG: SUMF1/EgtB/PvdO family nonheme iron enzyme, partial [Armatimonadetes bacterium]|nr:SUMF1/EgtB/PvdO family nonheme iron enzyme [Armatimonadota bacterium]
MVVVVVAGLLAGTALQWLRTPNSAEPDRVWRTMVNSRGMPLVFIPEGSFLMGLEGNGYENSQPIHRVTVSAFWMGRYEVTNQQWECFRSQRRPIESRGDKQPATRLLWRDVTAFCAWLGRKEGRHYRLPTEAEWEYAARGGLVQKEFPWGDRSPRGRATFMCLRTTPVGRYKPNGFGLCDMAGNVQEYCSDWYDPDYYQRSPARDPQGPPRPVPGRAWHVVRGGYFHIFEGMQCGHRWSSTADEDDHVYDPDDLNGA